MASGPLPAFLRHLRRLAARPGTERLSDRQLINRYVAHRDETAFAALVERHGPSVLAVGRRVLHDHHAAEDVFQATFLVLARKAASIRKRASLASWLYGVAFRLSVRVKGQAATRGLHEHAQVARAAVDPATDVIWRELGAVLDEELARLPEKVRAPLVLCYLEGKTQEVAARQLGWAVTTLHRRLEHGRDLLRVRLERRGVLLSTGLLAAALSQSTASVAVAAALVDSTIEAALAFGMEEAFAGLATAKAVTLAKGALQTMLVTKLKLLAVAVVSVSLLSVGAGALTHHVLAEKQAAGDQTSAPEPSAKVVDEPPLVEEPQARTDRYGDPLPDGALARIGTIRLRHGSIPNSGSPWASVLSLAYFPTGKTLASGGKDGKVRLWDVASGKEVGQFGFPTFFFYSLAVSPDGKTLAAGIHDHGSRDEEHSLRLWDLATGKEIRRFKGPQEIVWWVAFAPDGKTLASTSADHTLRLWDVATGKELHGFEGANLGRAVFSPDGKLLAYADGSSIRLWERAAGKEIRHLRGHRDAVWSLSFSPQGDSLASGSADNLRGEYVAPINGDYTIRVWKVATGKELRQFHGHLGGVSSVSFSPDGTTLASASRDKTIRLWEVTTGKELRRCAGYERAVAGAFDLLSVLFSPDGKTLASIKRENTVSLWDATTGKELHRAEGHQSNVDALVFLPDQTLASAGSDGTICVSEVGTGQELRRFPNQSSGSAWLSTLSPDGKTWASIEQDYSIRLWDVATGKLRQQLRGHRKPIKALVFSPDGKMLASGSFDETTRLWEVATGKELNRFATGHQDMQRYYSLAFSPDGKALAAGVEDRGIFLWDIGTGKLLHQIQGRNDEFFVTTLAFSPSGKTLATQNGAEFLLWEVAAGRVRSRFDSLDRNQHVLSFAFSPDGKTLFTTHRDFALRFWDVATGNLLQTLGGHNGLVTSIAFSSDGRLLATGSADTTILVWDAARLLREAQRSLGPSLALDLSAPLEQLWDHLASQDAEQAAKAIWVLAAAPKQSVPFLRERLRLVPSVDTKRITQLVKAIDSDGFAVRDEAMRALEQMGEAAEPTLRGVLTSRPPLEVYRRVKQLLDRLNGKDRLRALRALEVLEYIGTPEARQVLGSLASGAPEAVLTQEAKASLERLAKRSTTP